MQNIFDASGSSILAIISSAAGVYIAIIILTRIAGKRSFSKMSNFDFAMTISIGAMIATTVLSPSVSFVQGITGLTAIFVLELISNNLRQYSVYQKMIDNSPILLMDGSEILYKNLQKAKLTKEDLLAHLRKANVLQLSQVKAVIFENTGEISVLHSANSSVQLEDFLLTDVKN